MIYRNIPLAGQRALTRWLLQQDPFFQAAIELPALGASTDITAGDLEPLTCLLADQPGTHAEVDRDLALRFAHRHASDFEGVFWLSCESRSRAGILGDTAHMLGLKLRGSLEQNASALQAFCADRRLLFVFEHVAPSDRALVTFGGRASVMFVVARPLPAKSSLEQAAALFSDWRSNSNACFGVLGDVQSHLRDLSAYSGERWRMAVSLGSAAFSFARQAGRLAEAYELMDLMINAMRARDDLLAVHRLEWERSWILEEWNEPIPLRAPAISNGPAGTIGARLPIVVLHPSMDRHGLINRSVCNALLNQPKEMRSCSSRRECLQHVLAHEVSQVSNRLHRDGLIEQIQSLFVINPEAAAIRGAIGREAIAKLHIGHTAQTLSQFLDVRAEASEMLRDR